MSEDQSSTEDRGPNKAGSSGQDGGSRQDTESHLQRGGPERFPRPPRPPRHRETPLTASTESSAQEPSPRPPASPPAIRTAGRGQVPGVTAQTAVPARVRPHQGSGGTPPTPAPPPPRDAGAPRGPPHKSHRDETAECPFLGRPAFSEVDAAGSRPGGRGPAGRQDFHSNRRLLAPATPIPSAQARKGVGWPTASASARRPPGARGGVCVMASRGAGPPAREEAAGEWRCRRAEMARASAGPRTLPPPPARARAAPATTSCRGEGPDRERWVLWTGGWASWQVVAPGDPRGGSPFSGVPSGAGGPGGASSRFEFAEGEGRAPLPTPGLRSGRSELWKRGLGPSRAHCGHSCPPGPPSQRLELCLRLLRRREASDRFRTRGCVRRAHPGSLRGAGDLEGDPESHLPGAGGTGVVWTIRSGPTASARGDGFLSALRACPPLQPTPVLSRCLNRAQCSFLEHL